MDKIRILVVSNEENSNLVHFKPALDFPHYMQKEFDIEYCYNSETILERLASKKYFIIVTLENNNNSLYLKYPELFNLPSYYKHIWFNFNNVKSLSTHDQAKELVDFFCRYNKANLEFISIITPLYHTKKYVFERTYESLKNQTYKDWEWILIDDSLDKRRTEYIIEFAKKDPRIKYFNFDHSGSIGEVKRRGFLLAEGKWLVELDHDDILLENSLKHIYDAFSKYPQCGFVYSDSAEININANEEILGFRNYAPDENGNPTSNSWGLSRLGTAKREKIGLQDIWYSVNAPQNSQTVRHITAMPNHYRCWSRELYHEINGHNSHTFIVDDYELMVRTFLKTQFVHINSCDYIQHYEVEGTVNTQYSRNAEIQRLTEYYSKFYDKAIHERFIEIGIPDYSWNNNYNMSTYWDESIDKSQFKNTSATIEYFV